MICTKFLYSNKLLKLPTLLVKDSAVAADEAPLGKLNHVALVVLHGQADVEDLTVVGDVGVVSVVAALYRVS